MHATEARFRGWKDGRILHQSSLRLEERYGTPFYCIHRADFHSVLVRYVGLSSSSAFDRGGSTRESVSSTSTLATEWGLSKDMSS